MRRALLAGVLAVMAGTLPLAAREAPEILDPRAVPSARNPLEGHRAEIELPGLSLEIHGDEAWPAWSGPAYIVIDGKRAAVAALPPPAPIRLPRRRWTAGDWLKAGGIAAVAALLGAAAGALGALR